MAKQPFSDSIAVKKKYGQHFLRNEAIPYRIIDAVTLGPDSSVFEIGCGDGVLTKAILEQKIARLWVYEIDPEWAAYVQKKLPDPRLTIHLENILDVDFAPMVPYKPWVLLANLPYQITFPILFRLVENRDLLAEGVIMVQEEVAQKIVKTSGRGYGFSSLFFQYHFEWTMMEKVPPGAFFPPPKVNSRLLHFRPRKNLKEIPQAELFWKFIKLIFHQPRRTIKNNLSQTHYDLSRIDAQLQAKRAQQLSMNDLLAIWELIRV